MARRRAASGGRVGGEIIILVSLQTGNFPHGVRPNFRVFVEHYNMALA